MEKFTIDQSIDILVGRSVFHPQQLDTVSGLLWEPLQSSAVLACAEFVIGFRPISAVGLAAITYCMITHHDNNTRRELVGIINNSNLTQFGDEIDVSELLSLAMLFDENKFNRVQILELLLERKSKRCLEVAKYLSSDKDAEVSKYAIDAISILED